MPSIIDRLKSYFTGRAPVVARTHALSRQSSHQISAGSLDAELVHTILTQADAGDARQLMALYETIIFSDAHLQGELSKRKLAVLGDPWNVAPADPKNADDVSAAKFVEEQLKSLPCFFDACSALLDGCLYPVVVLERVYRPRGAGRGFDLADLIPVPAPLLHFDPQGPLRIFDVDAATGTILGTSQMIDPMRYVTHRGHLLGNRDHRGGPMRSLVFWSLFSAFDRDWWVRFLDKYGGAFLVGKYDQGDDDSRLVLERAFALATRLGGIVVSRDTEVEIAQAMSRDAGEAFELFHGICQAEKSKLIVGQTTSATAQSAGGLGSGVGEAQAAVRDDIRQFDRLRIADTLRHQVALPLLELNRVVGDVTISFGAEAPEDTEKTSRSLAMLANAGIEVAPAGLTTLGERMGLPLQRKTTPPESPLSGPSAAAGLAALSALADHPRARLADAANAQVARGGSADLARALGRDLAPMRRILALSSSPADFEQRLRDAFPDWEPTRTVPLLEAALTAYAGNALP